MGEDGGMVDFLEEEDVKVVLEVFAEFGYSL